MLKFYHVNKRYGEEEPWVLNDVSLAIQSGQSVAILGPSGSGKSTLLNLAAGLDLPNGGQVLWDQWDLTQANEETRTAKRNQLLGMIFQKHYLLGHLTVMENILLPLLGQRKPSLSDQQRAKELLQAVGLSDLENRPAAKLSVGQSQRVAVARAAINQPKLLLADEPTGSLDHATAAQVAELLTVIQKQIDATLIVVTHWPELAARMDHIFNLTDGRL